MLVQTTKQDITGLFNLIPGLKFTRRFNILYGTVYCYETDDNRYFEIEVSSDEFIEFREVTADREYIRTIA